MRCSNGNQPLRVLCRNKFGSQEVRKDRDWVGLTVTEGGLGVEGVQQVVNKDWRERPFSEGGDVV
jgi:hypothetical protein